MATPSVDWILTILVAFFAAYTFTRDLVFKDPNKAWNALYYAVGFVVAIVIMIILLP